MQITVWRYEQPETFEAKAFDLRGMNEDVLQLVLKNDNLHFIRQYETFEVEYTALEKEEISMEIERRQKQEEQSQARQSLLM